MFWRIYQVDDLAAFMSAQSVPIDQFAGLSYVKLLDKTQASILPTYGDPGTYWNLFYDNRYDRLFFAKGSSLQITPAINYGEKRVMSGNDLYGTRAFNWNSFEFIGEILFQASKGTYVPSRFVMRGIAGLTSYFFIGLTGGPDDIKNLDEIAEKIRKREEALAKAAREKK
jgi:hypothetical protein